MYIYVYMYICIYYRDSSSYINDRSTWRPRTGSPPSSSELRTSGERRRSAGGRRSTCRSTRRSASAPRGETTAQKRRRRTTQQRSASEGRTERPSRRPHRKRRTASASGRSGVTRQRRKRQHGRAPKRSEGKTRETRRRQRRRRRKKSARRSDSRSTRKSGGRERSGEQGVPGAGVSFALCFYAHGAVTFLISAVFGFSLRCLDMVRARKLGCAARMGRAGLFGLPRESRPRQPASKQACTDPCSAGARHACSFLARAWRAWLEPAVMWRKVRPQTVNPPPPVRSPGAPAATRAWQQA